MANLKDLIVLGNSRLIGPAYGNKFITDGGTNTQFVKGDGTLDSNTYLTSSDISGKVDKSSQSIADGTQHSATTDTTLSALVTIGTSSGSQGANLIPHDVVTGTITGTLATDKTKIPTAAAVAEYIKSNEHYVTWIFSIDRGENSTFVYNTNGHKYSEIAPIINSGKVLHICMQDNVDGL